MNASHEFIAHLIRDGNAIRMPDYVAAELDARVNEFPWLASHVAWHQLADTCRFDWGASSDAEAAQFVRGLSIGRFDRLCSFYGYAFPVLMFDANWLIENLDLAAANKEQYFIFGCENSRVNTKTFAELATARTIWGWTAHSDRVIRNG